MSAGGFPHNRLLPLPFRLAWSDDSSDNSDADIDETPNMFSREFWVKKVGSETMSHDEKERERELRRRRNEHHVLLTT